MTTLVELAAAVHDMEVSVERPSILAMFDSVFRPESLDPRKVTMEAVLNAMKPAIAPRED